MASTRYLAAIACLLASTSANATAAVAQHPAASEESVVVEGRRPGEQQPSIIQQLRSIIEVADSEQLARFEQAVCPMVIGMPRDLTAVLTRLIRENVVAVGGEVAKPGCSVNAAVIFIDNPQQLVRALYKEEPSFFYTFTPREFYYFAEQPRPVFSWHLTNTYTRDGSLMSQKVRSAAATRLYTNIREDMEAGIVVIDRSQTDGKSLRQLADFATMHLLLDVKPKAGRLDKSSILSLFEKRLQGTYSPARFSRFDRAALTGFYTQQENNRTAAAQRQNIAARIRQEQREPGEDRQ